MYKVKHKYKNVSFWMGRAKYVLANCNQSELKFLHDKGSEYVEYIEPKQEESLEEPKQLTKKRKSKKSVDGESK